MGNIIKCKITSGNKNDLKVATSMLKDFKGKIYGDKGYVSKKEFIQLLEQGLILITGIKKNMKNRLLELWDKILLRKRSLIESVFNIMKTLIAYCWKPNKPKIKFNKQETQLLQAIGIMN